MTAVDGGSLKELFVLDVVVQQLHVSLADRTPITQKFPTVLEQVGCMDTLND